MKVPLARTTLVNETDKYNIVQRDNNRRVRTHEKNSGDAVRRLDTILNTKHFLCPIRSQRSLDRLEMVRWESVPRGFSARAWKRSSRLFSRPYWLPLGLRGWILSRQNRQISSTREIKYQANYKLFIKNVATKQFFLAKKISEGWISLEGKYRNQKTSENKYCFQFPAIRFDAPTLLSFSGCTHAHINCSPVLSTEVFYI